MPDIGHPPIADIMLALWPSASFETGRARPRHPAGLTQFVALPSVASPTVLLPLRPRRAAAAVLRSHRAPSSTRDRLEQRVLVTCARLGAADLMPGRVGVREPTRAGQESVGAYLETVIGEPLVVGVHLGPPRANRKPILQLVGRRGDTLAFVKVGLDDLTCDLVAAETAALQTLSEAGLRSVRMPRVLHTVRWDGHPLLVLSPVETVDSARSRAEMLPHAMVELCDSLGRTTVTLAHSEYWCGLSTRLETVPGDAAAPLVAGLRALETARHLQVVELGSWHGDWTPWNMSSARDHLVVWDWERFSTGVPAGFDALHFDVQSAIRLSGLAPRAAVAAMSARAGDLLAPFGVAPDATALVVATYLLEIGSRYLGDRQEEAGARLGDLSSWLLPELSALVERVLREQPR